MIEKTAGDGVGVTAPTRSVTGASEVDSTNRSLKRRRAIDRLENLLGDDGGEASGGAIGVDNRLDPREAGAERAGGDQKRRRAVERPREIRDEAGPRQRSSGRVVNGNARVSLVLSQRGVERVEEPRGGGGVARGRANQVALAGGAGGNGAEVVGARIEALLSLRFDARDRLRIGGAEPQALERPAAGGDGQRGDESREDDPAERR